jgi:hypothetical protein
MRDGPRGPAPLPGRRPRTGARPSTLTELEAEGLVARAGETFVTTRRFQAALARAAFRLACEGAPWGGLRLPIAIALVELCGALPDDALAARAEALAELELRAVPWAEAR